MDIGGKIEEIDSFEKIVNLIKETDDRYSFHGGFVKLIVLQNGMIAYKYFKYEELPSPVSRSFVPCQLWR